MTKAEAAELVAVLVASFPGARVSDRTSDAYELMLADLDVKVANVAVRRLVGTAKFFPTIAEIREAATDIQHGARRTGAEAWGDVVRQIRRVGAYGEPRFDDPIVAEAVRSLGWLGLCLGGSAEASDRKRFVDLYEALSTAARRDLQSGLTLPAQRHAGAFSSPERALAPPDPKGDSGASRGERATIGTGSKG